MTVHSSLTISVYAYIFILMKDMARIFKALSDETRLRILSLLVSEGEVCVCDIMTALNLPYQSSVSRHLSYLKNSGWVNDRREGVWIYYAIDEDKSLLVKDIINLFERHLLPMQTSKTDRERLISHKKRCT